MMDNSGTFHELDEDGSLLMYELASRGERTPDINLVAVFENGEYVILHGFEFYISDIRRRCIILKPRLVNGRVVRAKHPVEEENEDLRQQNEQLRKKLRGG